MRAEWQEVLFNAIDFLVMSKDENHWTFKDCKVSLNSLRRENKEKIPKKRMSLSSCEIYRKKKLRFTLKRTLVLVLILTEPIVKLALEMAWLLLAMTLATLT